MHMFLWVDTIQHIFQLSKSEIDKGVMYRNRGDTYLFASEHAGVGVGVGEEL